MARELKYKCPVCQKPLSKKEFERALSIHEARQDHVDSKERELERKEREFEAHKKDVARVAREAERKRTSRMVGNKDKVILDLRKTIKLLKRGKTAQECGLEFEIKLVKQLRAEFARFGDDIRHEGRGGDVYHIVKDGSKVAGSIIYECKWTPGIKGEHIRQAAKAKMMRRSEFAVLVTSGTKRGFNGLDLDGDVAIVAPAGVIALASLLRTHIVGMFRAGVEKKRRARIANQLLRFIKSPEFKNPIEEVVRSAEQLRDGIEDEFRWHSNDWKKRLAAYERIRWDGWAIQENLHRVLGGEVPKELLQPRLKLALPASNGKLLEAR